MIEKKFAWVPTRVCADGGEMLIDIWLWLGVYYETPRGRRFTTRWHAEYAAEMEHARED